MSLLKIKKVLDHKPANGILPGIKGQRAFPIKENRYPDPFLLLDHIGKEKIREDFEVDGQAHPHRGFETITFMFEGELDHVDSLGNKVSLKSGGAQLMNAGRGILHGGKMRPDPITNVFNEIQLWINVPSNLKMSDPYIQNKNKEDIPFLNDNLRLISGVYGGVKGPIKTQSETLILHGKTDKGITLLESLPSDLNFNIYLLTGSATINNQKIDENQMVSFDTPETSEDSIKIEVINEETEFLIFGGKSLQEPMIMGGPFVMNSQEEIDQAFSDYEDGLFGEVH